MITELTLHNWKSFADATLYIDPLTFVIGTNASGKSNILDALDFLKKIANRTPITDVVQSIRGGKDWVLRKGADEFGISVRVQNGKTYVYSIVIAPKDNIFEIKTEELRVVRQEGDEEIVFKAEWTDLNGSGISYWTVFKSGLKASFSDEFNNSPAAISSMSVMPLTEDDREAVNTVVRNLRNIFILNPIPAAMRNYVPVSETLKQDASNLAGLIAGLEVSRKIEVELLLTKYIRPLPERDIVRVWTERVGLKDSDAMLYCEENWNGTPLQLDARGMSDGTLRFIAIIIAILTGAENSLLVIEEVDNGLHPSRAEELVNVLKTLGSKRSIDILCTTHNPTLIDSLGNTMAPFISYIKRGVDGNSEIHLLEDKDNLAKLMASNSLGGLMTNDLL